jgi:hypothetical protein
MDEEARAQPMKATKQQKPEVYRPWERDDLLSEVQKLIELKKAKDYKGSAYQHFILPIYTDEPELSDTAMRQFYIVNAEPSDSPLMSYPIRDEVEIYGLPLIETSEPSALRRRDVNEDILAAVLRHDETVTLGRIEPFHGTCRHLSCSDRLLTQWGYTTHGTKRLRPKPPSVY